MPDELRNQLLGSLDEAAGEPQPVEDENGDFDLDNPEGDAPDEDDEDKTPVVAPPLAPPPPRRGRPPGSKNRKLETAPQEIPVAQAHKKDSREPRQRTEPELPRDKVQELITSHAEVELRIRRKAPGGTWVDIRRGILLPPIGLFDLMEPVSTFCGGGTYVFEVLDPQTKQQLCSRWEEHYGTGRVKDPVQGYTFVWDEQSHKLIIGQDLRHQGSFASPEPPPFVPPFGAGPLLAGGPPPMSAPRDPFTGQLQPPPPELVPNYMTRFSPQEQWAHVNDQRKARGESPVALDWIHTNLRDQGNLQAELARERAQREAIAAQSAQRVDALVAKHTADLDSFRRDLAALTKQKDDEILRLTRANEQSAIDAKFAALEARLAGSSKKEESSGDLLLKMATALGPVLGPVLVQRTKAEAETATESRKADLALLTSVLARKEPDSLAGVTNLIAAIAPVALPLLLDYMKNSGPKVQAEILSMEHDQRLAQLNMLMEVMKSSMPEAPPAWQPLLESVIGMITMSWQSKMLSAQGAAQAPRQPAALPPQAPQQQPAPQPVVTAPPPSPGALDMEAVFSQLALQDAQATTHTRLVWGAIQPDQGFHTYEWLILIFNLHARLEVEVMADMIAGHLQHLANFRMLPPALVNVLEQPKAVFSGVLQKLPIFMVDPDYANAVLDQLEAMLTESDEEEETSESEPEESEVLEHATA